VLLLLLALAACALLARDVLTARSDARAAGRARSEEPLLALGPRAFDAAARGAFAIFFAFYLPYAHVFDIGALFGERFAFAPSVGFVLLVALVGARTVESISPDPRARRALAAAAVALLGVAGAWRSALRASEWRDGVRLWEAARREIPDDWRVLSNLATHLLDRGDTAAAKEALLAASTSAPDEPIVLSNLASVALREGDLEEAARLYLRVLAASPANAFAWNNLGVVRSRQGFESEAAAHFRRALAINFNYVDAHANLRDAEARLAAARVRVEADAARAETSEDPAFLRRFAAACRALGDEACWHRFVSRAGAAGALPRAQRATP
jgi:Tfp pilus assembly protein PilF